MVKPNSSAADSHFLIPVIPFTEAVMSYGKGSYLYDVDRKKYLDLNAGQFCAALGHSNPAILDAVYSSISGLAHTSTSIISEEVISCSANIHRISGDMKASCILLSTGAEVVEFCMRYAKHITKREGIICFDRGYHGLTLGAQSVTYGGVYATPSVRGVHFIPVPVIPVPGSTGASTDVSVDAYPATAIDDSIAHLEAIMKNGGIAAVLFEPIVSVGGMLFPPAEWFKKVRVLCDRYDVLLVLDECQTGFGRTGEWFAYQSFGFVPDMVATAKGIGLGFPVAVAMFREALIPDDKKCYDMTHYSSHQNDPFAAAVVNVGIDYMERHNILCGIREKGEYFLRKLTDLERSNDHIVSARGCGLMLGAELSFKFKNGRERDSDSDRDSDSNYGSSNDNVSNNDRGSYSDRDSDSNYGSSNDNVSDSDRGSYSDSGRDSYNDNVSDNVSNNGNDGYNVIGNDYKRDYRVIYNNLYKRMLADGVIIQGTNGGRTLRFLPDYLIGLNDIDYAVETLDQALRSMSLK